MKIKELVKVLGILIWFILSQLLVQGIFLMSIMEGKGEQLLHKYYYGVSGLGQIICMIGLIGITSIMRKKNRVPKEVLSELRIIEDKKVTDDEKIMEGLGSLKEIKFLRKITSLKEISYWGKYVVYGVGLWAINIGINMILIPVFSETGQVLVVGEEMVMQFLVIVVIAPIVEEYVFRGQIQGYLKKAVGEPLSILGGALLFGSVHGSMVQKCYATVSGIILGSVKEKEASLKGNIIMHMMANLMGWLMAVLI